MQFLRPTLLLIFGEGHLWRVLALYAAYYNETRTHLGLGKDPPLGRLFSEPEPSSPHQSCQDCIIDTPGYDFREGQACTPSWPNP